ncbi:MAG TPA: SAM-dependent methyltransferase [Acidimicrobiales bacterium]
MVTPLDREVVARIHRHGPIGCGPVIDLALYDPDDGFYGSGRGRAGRRGDFLTSPEVGPLFGAVIARALDAWWDELGRPDPFTVVEAGAGRAMLARTVLLAEPRCATALTYVLVERSPVLRAEHADHLPVTDPSLAFPPRAGDDDDDEEVLDDRGIGTGPRVVSLAELPALGVVGVVLANELLDNLSFALVQRTDDGWDEVRLALTGDDLPLVEHLVPASAVDAALADRLAPGAAVGARLPLQREAGAWLSEALARVHRGRVVVIDYASSAAELADRPWTEWVRTYQGHGPGGSAWEDLGSQDITCEVDETQLALVRRPDRAQDQAAFLDGHGLAELVAEGRRVWAEQAHVGDLPALRARSRVAESEALVDPAGLGAFRVFEWLVD